MANEIDVTVYGATGFTGTLIAEYAASRMGEGGFSLALAGRNPDKLAAVHAELGLGDDVELIVADGDDLEALTAMADRSKVVIAAAGPYLQYGSKVVEACVATGTDYVDLCGEPNWMRTTIDTHADAAASTGARIVHSCGFDSVPSDLGVFRLQAIAHAEQGSPIARVKGRVRDIRGSASGGTVASFMATMAASQADPAVGANVLNPHGLTASQTGVAQPDGTAPVYDEDLGQWASPFVMALINTKTIHRSNDLLGGHYGDIEYDEMVSTGPGDDGKAMADALAASGGGMDGVVVRGVEPACQPTPEPRSTQHVTDGPLDLGEVKLHPEVVEFVEQGVEHVCAGRVDVVDTTGVEHEDRRADRCMIEHTTTDSGGAHERDRGIDAEHAHARARRRFGESLHVAVARRTGHAPENGVMRAGEPGDHDEEGHHDRYLLKYPS